MATGKVSKTARASSGTKQYGLSTSHIKVMNCRGKVRTWRQAEAVDTNSAYVTWVGR